jgi:hypothetical protein
MTLEEKEHVLRTLVATAEVMGGEMKPTTALVMAQDLDEYPFHEVMTALNRVRKEATGRLTLKAIIDMLSPGRDWLSANEAWSLALPAADERNTVVWTREARDAFNIALPLLEEGDKIGARMAFIAAYDRSVSIAKAAGGAPNIEVSEGWDKQLRAVAVDQAVNRGLLPPQRQEDALALPNLSPEQVKDNRARMAELMRTWRESMRQAEYDAEAEQARQRQEARQKFEAHRDEVVAQALAMDEERKREDAP